MDIGHRILDIFGKGHEAAAFYSVLLRNSQDDLPALRSTWEADLNIGLSEENWGSILKNSKKVSRELKTRLIQFKILHRVYWTLLFTFAFSLVPPFGKAGCTGMSVIQIN